MTAALIVIDVQNDYCHADGGCNNTREAFPFWSTEQIDEMLPVLRRTVADARAAGVPVIWVRSEYSSFTMSRRVQRRGAGKPLHICVPGTWGYELHDGFEPAEGEPLITKPRYSPFVGTEFELALRVQGVERLLIAGVTTNVCVESTARDAFMRDFDAVVLSDCCASYAREKHEAALWNVRTHFGSVMTAGEALGRQDQT